jgi:glycosyltransferase involved in cell wall biosynthesis
MITGTPELGCGVSDYSVSLAAALADAGVDVELLTQPTWGPRSVARVRDRLRRLAPDLVHLQYPTASYRTSLAPHVLSLLEAPAVLTLHEATQAHPLRQLSLLALLARAGHVVFTSAAERNHVLRTARWLRDRTSVIPIGSAIPRGTAPAGARADRVVAFGLLTPEKGLDDVFALAQRARSRPGTRVLVIGRVEKRFAEFGASLGAAAEGLPVDWALDRDATEVADLLAGSAVGYLPYPDGASGRRSSLLALLTNGVATITTPGPFVDGDLAGAVDLAPTPEAAWARAQALLDDPLARDAAAERGRRYAQERDWGAIASRHAALYAAMAPRPVAAEPSG